MRTFEAANAACLKEWDRLIAQGCWDLSRVSEWQAVKRKADAKGQTIHIGALHELCFEKGWELPQGDPSRKYKGRVVFLGDRVRDQNGKVVVFEELSSSPAALEAGKLCDLYGRLMGACPGGGGAKGSAAVPEDFVTQQGDAVQAYCQAKLKGTTPGSDCRHIGGRKAGKGTAIPWSR